MVGKQPSMNRIGMGLVGAGFVGPHHVDAVRRLGFVDIVAVAGQRGIRDGRRPRRSARERATAATRRCSTTRTCTSSITPPRTISTTRSRQRRWRGGKHVVSDKPLAMTFGAGQAPGRRCPARRRDRRGYVQLPRQPPRATGPAAIARGDIGARTFCTATTCRTGCSGHSLLLASRSRERRCLVRRCRHRIPLVRPRAARDRSSRHARPGRSDDSGQKAEEAARITRRVSGGQRRRGDTVDIRVEDLASVLVRFDNGARGCFSVGQGAAATRTTSCSKCAVRGHLCAGGRRRRTSSGSATATRPTRCY